MRNLAELAEDLLEFNSGPYATEAAKALRDADAKIKKSEKYVCELEDEVRDLEREIADEHGNTGPL
jgi:hypothetical protein